jgi:hypothetical protein
VFHKTRGIFRLAEELLACQEGLCSTEFRSSVAASTDSLSSFVIGKKGQHFTDEAMFVIASYYNFESDDPSGRAV